MINIGTLSRNKYWQEERAVRPPVATTSMVRSDKVVLVDPSLPGELMVRRLHERSGLRPDQIDMVFLTSFNPTHRRGIEAFNDATWLIGEREREVVARHLNGLLEQGEGVPADIVEAELALLGRMDPAPDEICRAVHLFPMPGVTPGLCGLLVAGLHTVVIAGDAVLTRDHLANGDIGDEVADREQATESLRDLLEVADIIVCGHDNLIVASGGG